MGAALRTRSLCQLERLHVQTETPSTASLRYFVPPLLEHPIHLFPFVLFASQIQEAASRGLKFVGVIPQYHCPGHSAGGSPPADAWGATEPGRCAATENLGAADAPVGTDGSPEPGQGPRGEAPTAQQPGSPSGARVGTESPPRGVSETLDGPDGDPLEGHGEPLSGSKYVSAGTLTRWERGC